MKKLISLLVAFIIPVSVAQAQEQIVSASTNAVNAEQHIDTSSLMSEVKNSLNISQDISLALSTHHQTMNDGELLALKQDKKAGNTRQGEQSE